MGYAEIESRKEALRTFALRCMRECNIRRGDFAPQTPEEFNWAKVGAVDPVDLTSVQEQKLATFLRR